MSSEFYSEMFREAHINRTASNNNSVERPKAFISSFHIFKQKYSSNTCQNVIICFQTQYTDKASVEA